MIEKHYDRLWDLFLELRAHTIQHKSEVLIYDDPKRLLIGWAAVSANLETDQAFYIRLNSLKNMTGLQLPFDNKIMFDLFKSLVTTRPGRIKLVEMVTLCPQEKDLVKVLERILNLKAFW